MERVRTQFSVEASADLVYQAISHVENIPLYAAGITEAHAVGPEPGPDQRIVPEAAENLVDLVTRSGRHMDARIIEAMPGRRWTVEDENGTRATWELIETDRGTLATYTLHGEFAEDAARIRSEVRSKIAKLVLELEALARREGGAFDFDEGAGAATA
ncbi:MAG: SRPBCC family protein [Candidatus Thermoplasmatota archaeon]|nr:SRPBCC family protein [Candidatus Thermoplasmatota archaeon]